MSFTEQIQALKDGETLSGKIYDITDVPGGWIFAHKEFKQLIFVPIPGINRDEINVWPQNPMVEPLTPRFIPQPGTILCKTEAIKCSWCNGMGFVNAEQKCNGEVLCPVCKGEGNVGCTVNTA